jgi:hypothetical protein
MEKNKMMMTKKEMLKKACGKGGFKEGFQNIGSHAKKNYNEAYSSNMAQYKKDSGIDKNMFPDSIMAGAKGAIYGGIGAIGAMGENLKSNIDKVKSIVNPKKELLNKIVKKTGVGTRYPDMKPLKTSMSAKRVNNINTVDKTPSIKKTI